MDLSDKDDEKTLGACTKAGTASHQIRKLLADVELGAETALWKALRDAGSRVNRYLSLEDTTGGGRRPKALAYAEATLGILRSMVFINMKSVLKSEAWTQFILSQMKAQLDVIHI